MNMIEMLKASPRRAFLLGLTLVCLTAVLVVPMLRTRAQQGEKSAQPQAEVTAIKKPVLVELTPQTSTDTPTQTPVDDTSRILANTASSANYTFVTNTTASFTDMSTGTTQLAAADTDDAASVATSIGFDFFLMGNRYTQFSASSNGIVGLGGTAVGSGTYTVSTGTPASPIISAFGGDLRTGISGKAHYKVTGAAPNRILTIEFLNMSLLYVPTPGSNDGTYQVRFYETTGKIEFVYGSMTRNAGTTALNSQQVGIGFATNTTTNNLLNIISATNTSNVTSPFVQQTYATGAIANLNTPTDGSRRIYSLTPPTPTAATALNFTGVTTNAMTLNWTDSPNEVGYAIYRSLDGITYTFAGAAASDATSFAATGLSPSTNYFWQVYALSEGALSTALPGTQATSAPTPISGTKTVGPTGDFGTLTAAFAFLAANGVNGALTIELQSTYTSGTETFPIVASNFPGNSGTNTITVRPATGATALSISSANTTATLDLNGAQNVIFDGRPAGTGVVKQLTIADTSTSGVAVRFINDAISDKLQFCTLTGVNTSTTSGVVLFSTTTGANGNDNNTIDTCDIRDGASTPNNGIYSSGTTTTTATNNSGNTISNNNIFNFFAAAAAESGITLSLGNTDWTITGNSLYQTATRTETTAATDSGITISNTSGNNFVVINNFIGGGAASAGGTAWTIAGSIANRFRGISLSVGSTTPTSVHANTVANFNFTSNSASTTLGGPWVGIYLTAGNASVGTSGGNTIGSATGTGSITLTMVTNSGGISSGIYCDASATTSSISNNVVGSVTQSSATIGSGFTGIVTTAGTTLTLNNNFVGSPATANSINAGAYTGATAQIVTGINNSSSAAIAITNNTIANVNNGYLPAAANSSSVLRGIVTSSGVNTITGNTVRNLSTAAQTSGTTIAASVIGISQTSTSAGQTVSSNTVRALSNTHATAASNIIGIVYTGPTTGANIVAKNLINTLSAPSTTAVLTGIHVTAGTSTFQNNMIDLGNGISTSAQINGINEAGGTDNFFHNSIYIGGTAVVSGAINTFAFTSTVTANVRSFRDNIFFNARSNTSGTGVHYAIQVGGTTANPAGLTTNNNILFANGTGGAVGRFNAVTQTTLANWQTATGQDANSFSSDPQYLDPTNATPDLHINPSVLSLAEGNGADVGVIDDFDGQTRSTLTPVDIGADAGNFTGIDLTPPSISYTTLINTTQTTDRSLAITVTDNSGVPTAGAGLPVIYYKRNAGSYVNSQCTFVSGSSYTCPILASSLPGLVTGDTVSYYVAAQDSAAAPNVTTNPLAGASGFTANPPAASTPPTTPNSYLISVGYSGTLTVDAAGAITSLTNAGGLFQTLNNGVLAGNLTVNINSDLTAETGTFALNRLLEEGVGNYTITINPIVAAHAISGSATTALIRTNGASRVLIDGSIGGTGTDRSLTITNTSATTPGVVNLGSVGTTPVVNDTLKNCILINGASTSSAVVVGDGTTIGAAGFFNNITIQNNSVQKAFRGILVVATVSGTNGSGTLITGNTLNTAGANSIRLNPIAVQGVNGVTISNNTMGNISDANAEVPIGILLATGTDNATVSGNTISSIVSSSSSTLASASGILVSVGAASTNITVTNNNVSTLTSAGTAGAHYGIASFSPNVTISNNTVSGMTQTGATSSWGIVLVGTANNTVSGNTVSGMTISGSTSVTSGIQAQGASTGVTISGNRVFNIKNTNSSGYGANGIQLGSTSTTANITAKNNFVYDVAAFGFAGGDVADNGYGMIVTSGAGYSIYNNSVLMNTNQTATTGLPAAFNVLTAVTTAGAINLRNNIFANTQTVGTERYAIYSGAANTVFAAIDFNDYFTNGPDRGFIGSNRTTLADIVTGFGGNTNSKSVDPLFVDNISNLHLQGGSTLIGQGTPIASVNNDFDNDLRDDVPEIGADEITTGVRTGAIPAGNYANADIGTSTLAGDVTITGNLVLSGVVTGGAFTLTIDCGASVSGAGAGNYVIGNVRKNFCTTGAFTYPVGTANGYSPVDVTDTATGGTVNDSLSVKAVQGYYGQAGETPALDPLSLQRYWDLNKTGSITADIKWHFLPGDVMDANYGIIRVSGATAARFTNGVNCGVNPTASPCVDVANNFMFMSGVSNFSKWTAGKPLAPTASGSSIGGRVLDASGRPIANARVTLNRMGGETTSVQTGPFGYYQFTDITVGYTYVVSVSSGRHTFAVPSRVINLTTDALGEDFIAEP